MGANGALLIDKKHIPIIHQLLLIKLLTKLAQVMPCYL